MPRVGGSSTIYGTGYEGWAVAREIMDVLTARNDWVRPQAPTTAIKPGDARFTKIYGSPGK